MWEKCKTYALIFLILLSLAMSYRLWFGTPNYEAITLPSFEQVPPGDASSSVNLLLPEKIAFYPVQAHPQTEPPSGEESPGEQPTEEEETDAPSSWSYIFFPSQENYMLLWEDFTQQLNSVETVSLSPVNQEEIQARLGERNEPALEISFTAPFYAELFFPTRVRVMDLQEFPLIQNFYLFGGEKPQAFCRTSQGSLFQVSWNISFLTLFNQLKELAQAEEPDHFLLSELADTVPFTGDEQLILEEVFVPKQVPSLPDFSFSREFVEKEALARIFFVDLSLVRQIKERDEAIIFTDGQKGLRISSQGMIEYTAPLQRDAGKRLSYREALDIGAEYVSLYVDLPEEIQLRITDLMPVILDGKEYYQMKLRGYFGGVFLDPEDFTVELTYDQQGLVNYTCQRYTINSGEEERLTVDVIRALSEVVSSRPEIFQQEDPRRITAAYLVYTVVATVSGESLQPYWNIEIDGKQRVMINARNDGEVSPGEDLK